MITNEVMSPASDAAAARYGNLVEMWRLTFLQAASQNDLGTAKSFSAIYSRAYEQALGFIRGEGERIAAELHEIATAALTATSASYGGDVSSELTVGADEALVAAVEHLRHEMIVQIERDVAYLVRALRQHALQVTLAARSQRVPISVAIMQSRIGTNPDLKFLFTDRSGAKWPSRKFIRTAWRHEMLGLYNDVSLLTLADHGVAEAEIEHINVGADVHEMRLSMSPNGTLPTYDEIRAQVFHPNADAIVVPPGGL